MDAAMVVEATGQHKYEDKGNMTKAEIDLTMKILTEAKKSGQFRRSGRTSTSPSPDGLRETIIQVDVVALR